jgi:hypothetical protein
MASQKKINLLIAEDDTWILVACFVKSWKNGTIPLLDKPPMANRRSRWPEPYRSTDFDGCGNAYNEWPGSHPSHSGSMSHPDHHLERQSLDGFGRTG